MATPYAAGIEIGMSSNVPQMLALMSKNLLGVHGRVEELTRGFSALRMGVLGAVTAMTGSAILHGLGHIIEHGNALVKIQRDLAQAGVTNVEIQEAYAKAWEMTGKHTNVKASEILHLIQDSRAIFGSTHQAIHDLDPFVESMAFLRAYQGHAKGTRSGESLNREIFAAMKSGEIAGKVTPEELSQHVKALTGMKVLFGDQLKITQYLTAQRNAGVAMRNADDSFRYGTFAALVQEQGQRAGTQFMTAFQKLFAGTRNTTKALDLMADLGLIKKSDIEVDKVGRAKGLNIEGHLVDYLKFARTPDEWVWKVLKPLIEKRIDKDVAAGKVTEGERGLREAFYISKILPDRQAAMFGTELLQQESKLRKDARMLLEVIKSLNMPEYMNGSWDYQLQSFHEQWTNFLEAFGAPMVGTATAMLRNINGVIKDMGQWMSTHPEVARLIGSALGALGIGLAVLGTAMVGAAIVSLVAGIAALAALPWMAVAAYIVTASVTIARHWTEIKTFFRELPHTIYQNLVVNFKTLPARVGMAITEAIIGIAEHFKSQLKILWESIKGFSPIAYQGDGIAPPPRMQSAGFGNETKLYLDGRLLATAVSERIVRDTTFMGSVGSQDTRGTWLSPGATIGA